MTARLRLLLLDLDGTLIESLAVKDTAFARLYADAPRFDEIMAYHRSHNHVVRFKKFRHISEHFLGRPLSAEEDAGLRKTFESFVVDGLVRCPEVAGARRFLDTYQGVVPMVLISHSPDGELRRVLAARGLDRYFEAIYSADWTKQEAIADALTVHGVSAAETVYVGDSPEDAGAAAANGVAFVGRRSDRNLNVVEACVFADMNGVREHLAAAYRTE